MKLLTRNSVLLVLAVPILAIATPPGKGRERIELTKIWHPLTQSENAASPGISGFTPYAVTQLGYTVESGDLHRSQEGNARKGLNFFSERYDRIGKNWISYGSFQFIMDREENRRWSDVFTTYHSNPYIFGSNVKASYDRQLVDFHAKIGSCFDTPWNIGLGIDYKVGDLSRLLDPRTRVFLADYAFRPAVTYRINPNHSVGLQAIARYEKEKMPNITTVQDDPNLAYYTFSGMENADAVIGGFNGFERQFVSRHFGGDIQYAVTGTQVNALLTAGISYQQQQILENIRQSPGSYRSLHYRLKALLTRKFTQSLLHLSLNADIRKGAANENLQELITVRDTATGIASQEWVTLYTYTNRYTNSAHTIELNANLRDIDPLVSDYKKMIGIKTGTTGSSSAYHLPYSYMKSSRWFGEVYGYLRLLRKNQNQLSVQTAIRYESVIDNQLSLSGDALIPPVTGDGTYKRGTYDVANQVLIPDFNYAGADVAGLALSAEYSFPLQIKKSSLKAFIKAHFQTRQSSNSGHWNTSGITIGIYP